MRRRTIVLFACLGLFGVSCNSFVLTAPANPDTLPPVSLAPQAAPQTPALPPQVDRVLEVLSIRHTGLSARELPALAATIVEEADRNGMDPALVLAVIHVESGFYHRAVSPVGALGLMQLMPATAAELAEQEGLIWRGADSLLDPILNVKLGVKYLRQLEDRFGNLDAALAAYNWGPGRIRERLRRGDTLPAIYVDRVMTSYTGSYNRGAVRSS